MVIQGSDELTLIYGGRMEIENVTFFGFPTYIVYTEEWGSLKEPLNKEAIALCSKDEVQE